MSGARRKTQWAVVAAIAAVCLIAVFAIQTLMGSPSGNSAFQRANETLDPSIVEDRTRSASPEASWIATSTARLEEIEAIVQSSQSGVEENLRETDAQVAALRREYDEQISQMVLKIQDLETQLGAQPTGRVTRSPSQTVPGPAPGNEEPDPFLASVRLPRAGTSLGTGSSSQTGANGSAPRTQITSPLPGGPMDQGAFGQSFTLAAGLAEPTEEGTNRKSLSGYVPAGTYAPAIVLTGADASTNVRGREDPVPVLMRITGPGTTAGRAPRNGAKIPLTGCTVQGSATGDLSAERVMVRLTTITCQNTDGTVSEAAIRGYMTNSGKAGARGRVVSREGNLVTNAAIAGALEGLGSAVGTGAALGVGDRNDGGELAARVGVSTVGGGVASAGGQLAEYYIDRAEAYTPVISLYGGTPVEIVFMEGFDL